MHPKIHPKNAVITTKKSKTKQPKFNSTIRVADSVRIVLKGFYGA